MWTYSPSLMVIVGTLTCVMILWGQIWADKQNKTSEKYTCPIFLFVRGGILTAFAFIGIFLLDGVLRLCFSDLVSFGSFKYALAAVILCTGLGFFLIFGTVFVAPTWKTLVSFGVMLAAALVIGILSISDVTLEYTDFLIICPCVGVGTGVVLTLFDLVYRTITRNKRSKSSVEPVEPNPSKRIPFKKIQELLSPPLWDLSNRFKKAITPKVYIVIFGVFIIELILLFEGVTYFVWI